MAADPPGTDPDEQTPQEADLRRRSDAPAISPWLILGLIAMAGVLVYVISAIT